MLSVRLKPMRKYPYLFSCKYTSIYEINQVIIVLKEDFRMNIGFLLVFAISSHALKVYQSLALPENQSGLAGLEFKDSSLDVEFSNSITICTRFNFGRLQNAVLFEFANDEERYLKLSIRYPNTWLSFGDSLKGPKSFASWVLQDPLTKDYAIFFAKKWHHICLTFDSSNGQIRLILVNHSLLLN